MRESPDREEVDAGLRHLASHLQREAAGRLERRPAGTQAHRLGRRREVHVVEEDLARTCVEQGSELGWERYVGPKGRVIGMKAFGASAPLKELQRKFGFEPDKVVAAALEMLGRK